MKARVSLSIIVLLYIIFPSTSVQGVVIPLSTHSSEPSVGPNSIPASWLDASMALSVANTGQWELSVEVSNLTPDNVGDFAFKMTELYFNTTAPIASLTLDSVVGGNVSDWILTFDMDNIKADGFGLYDISIITNDITSVWINSLETLTFNIIIDGSAASYTDADFFDLSASDPLSEAILAYGAAKFVKTGDPEDLSAYGAYVPEPTTILMLGLGTLALLRKR